jgi:hypothetical protein
MICVKPSIYKNHFENLHFFKGAPKMKQNGRGGGRDCAILDQKQLVLKRFRHTTQCPDCAATGSLWRWWLGEAGG